MPTINGHTLTREQTAVLDALQDYVRKYGGDTVPEPQRHSPRGDGHWVNLVDVFPRSNRGTAARRTVERLYRLGVLKVCQIAYVTGSVKSVPLACVEQAEADERSRRFSLWTDKAPGAGA